MRRRFLAIGGVLMVLLAGCSSGRHLTAGPPTTTTAASSPNPDVVPAVITPAYVDAVFAVLNHINGNAARALLAARAITPKVTAELRAIYGPPLYNVEVQVFRAGLTQDTDNLKRPLGDRVTKVVRLITAAPTCIFVQTVSDFTAVELHPSASPAAEYWELQPKNPLNDPEHLNPTPWAMTYNRDYQTPTTLASLC